MALALRRLSSTVGVRVTSLLAPKKAASRAATASSPCVATVVIQARFNTTVPLALVKQLREKTKAGISDCKEALQQSGLDLEKAEKWLRERAAVIAKKKSGRAAAEGVIAVSADTSRAQAVMVELLCETDFAARSPSFLEAAGAMAQKALALSPEELTSFSTNPAVQEAIQSLAFTLRENVTVRRATRMAGDVVGWYVHNKQDLPASLAEAPERATNKIILGQKAALVELSLTPAGNIPKSVPSFADSVALHAVAMSPKYLTLEEATAQDPQAEQSEVLLLQDFTASDDSQTVEKAVKQLQSRLKPREVAIKAFARWEVGEGVQRKSDNLADEVSKLLGDK